MNKRILVFDSNPDRRNMHCVVLVSLGCEVWKWEDEEIVTCSGPADDNLPRCWDLILLHSPGSDADKFGEIGVEGPILRYCGDGAKGPTWVPRAISGGSPLNHDELASFVQTFFSRESPSVEDVVQRSWPPTDRLIALRLLCEAYAIVPIGKGSKKLPADKPIQLACPDPEEWLAYFGLSKPSSESDNSAINAFARLMGTAECEAKELARAIFQPGSDISGPAGKFVVKVTEITATQAGGAK